MCIVGTAACLLAFAFAGCIEWLEMHLWEPLRTLPFAEYLAASIALLTLAGLVGGWLMGKWEPQAAG